MILDEAHFDAMTALGATGPAYTYVVLEALAEGGVQVGLPETSQPSWSLRRSTAPRP